MAVMGGRLPGQMEVIMARRELFQVFSVCMSLVVAWAGFLPPLVGATPAVAETTSALLAAIRAGDLPTVQALLDRGVDVNGSDDAGTTALMQAALHADIGMMELLLNKGADVDARNKSGATALLRALHDPAKVELLLEHRARIPDVAVFLAVTIPGASRTVKQLTDHGANLAVSQGAYTPLMAAARSGDLDTIRFLIEQGADVRARTRSGYTPLYAAASWPGNAAAISLLLKQGADPDTRVETSAPARDLFTPVMVAAMRGDAESLERLLAGRANVNVQGGAFDRTALLWAATTGSEETVELLLNKGADVRARDHLGLTPLQWARRRGDTKIVKLLEKKTGAEGPTTPRGPEPAGLAGEHGTDSLKRAVGRSLPRLQQSSATFSRRNGCVSCHHQSLVAMTIGLARRHGFEVDNGISAQERTRVLSILEKDREKILLGTGVTDELLPAYALAGLAAEQQKPNATTDALVHFLVLRQRQDGSWRTPVHRPPHDASDWTFTALAVRGLDVFASPGRRKEIEGRIGRARKWLVASRPRETEDKAFHLLGLRWANADRRKIQEAVTALLREQRSDGGWAQLPTLSSDAYATGQVLFALAKGGAVAVSHPTYQRGVRFLLKTQLADGSWFVGTRSFPLQPYAGTGFPHGRSQFISLAATSWATMALARTAGRRDSRD
jgi:ankyrin repeat protein